ncbi:MAG: cysteine--tRNA ligase [bacterium]|nr:cysteine--tRNA ligase [bacterium]
MPLQFHNSLSGKKEPFTPADPDAVTMYNCGPTVYNFNHLGNFRAYAFVDLLRRYLKFRGYGLVQTTNITDVDDKIVNSARESGRKIEALTAPYIAAYLEDLAYLGIEGVEHRPRATGHIPAMLEMIQALDRGGHTYTQDGNVYFRLASYPNYGKLSGIDPEQLRTAADGRFAADEYEKENARDFALWKAPQHPEEECWDSPYGRGRPGWHLECSAMIREIYGAAGVDIHTGGIDLLFPHHENEIAQSQCAHPEDNFVGLWLHNEHLLVDGQKMAKSAGNFFTLRDFSERDRLEALVAKGAPAALLKLHERGDLSRCLRYTLIGTHYRQKLNFSFTAIVGAESSLKRLQNTIERLKAHAGMSAADLEAELEADDSPAVQPGADPIDPMPDAPHRSVRLARANFTRALDDDLNIAKAFAALFDLCRDVNQELDDRDLAYAREALVFLGRANQVLNVFDFSDAGTADKNRAGVDGDLAARVTQAISDRKAAKADKNFAEADRIRDELKAEGIVLKDGPDGTTWEKA